MTGSPGIRLAPDPLPGPREALVIATANYQDPGLSQLRATADDALVLTEVLSDPVIGGFTVTAVMDGDERQVRRSIDMFLSSRGPGDVVLVYLSCHGVLDRRSRLHFAAADTATDQLNSTGIAAAWLLEQLEECRARQQVLILDCCFSGAFAKGTKGERELDLERRLAGASRGRAVLTASRSGEYSFTGDALPGAAVSGSVFTTGLVEGLRTGAADADGDGYISVDEAYDFAYRHVLSLGAAQTPQRWLSGGEGSIVLARSPAGIAIAPAVLPEELVDALESRYSTIRIGAVHELGSWLAGDDPSRALAAEQKLREIADNDNHTVAVAASAYLTSPGQTVIRNSLPRYNIAKDENSEPEVDPPLGMPPADLEITDLRPGSGKAAKDGDTVSVHYVGVSFSNGAKFQSTWSQGKPFEFRLGKGQVITGFNRGIEGMKVGGRRKLVIPPHLAYGNSGAGNGIKPGETLIFVCDLRSIL